MRSAPRPCRSVRASIIFIRTVVDELHIPWMTNPAAVEAKRWWTSATYFDAEPPNPSGKNGSGFSSLLEDANTPLPD